MAVIYVEILKYCPFPDDMEFVVSSRKRVRDGTSSATSYE
jgi:hypothetical protein